MEVNFPDYKNFDNVNAYSNFIQKIMEVTDKVAPVNDKRFERNSQGSKEEKEMFQNKLKDCIGKPKDLWKAIKSL